MLRRHGTEGGTPNYSISCEPPVICLLAINFTFGFSLYRFRPVGPRCVRRHRSSFQFRFLFLFRRHCLARAREGFARRGRGLSGPPPNIFPLIEKTAQRYFLWRGVSAALFHSLCCRKGPFLGGDFGFGLSSQGHGRSIGTSVESELGSDHGSRLILDLPA